MARLLSVPVFVVACEWGLGPTDVCLQGRAETGEIVYCGLSFEEAEQLSAALLKAAQAARDLETAYIRYIEAENAALDKKGS
jgi:hypothetical protein